MSESSPPLPTTLCAGCGKPMAWIRRPAGEDQKGATVPLDVKAVCFLVIGTNAENTKAVTLKEFFQQVAWIELRKNDEQGNPIKMPVAAIRAIHVSHFATCSHARQFSGKNKAKNLTAENAEAAEPGGER